MGTQVEDVLKVEGVSKRFGHRLILDDINLNVKKGDVFGIIGVSGVGKTTLLNLLIGALRPEKGDIKFKAEGLLIPIHESHVYFSVHEEQRTVKRLFGFAAQMPSFYDDLTIIENLEYFGHLYDLKDDILKKNIEIALSLVDLQDCKNILASNLSGGMKKRLDIACALVHDPKILILDEPTADLDVLLRRQMWDLVRKINAKGTTVIIASHFLDEIETLCNSIALLHNKKLIAKGNVVEIKKLYAPNEEIHLQTYPGDYKKIISTLGKSHIKTYSITPNGLVVYSSDAPMLLERLLKAMHSSKERLINVDLKKPPLSEIFEELTKKR